MKQCPKCHSINTSLLSHRQLTTMEDEHLYQCKDCGKEWAHYEDMNASDARDMRNYLEQQRYERGDY